MEVVSWGFLSSIVGHIQLKKTCDRNLDLFLDLRLKYPALALKKVTTSRKPFQNKNIEAKTHRSHWFDRYRWKGCCWQQLHKQTWKWCPGPWGFLSSIVGHIKPKKIWDRNLDLFLISDSSTQHWLYKRLLFALPRWWKEGLVCALFIFRLQGSGNLIPTPNVPTTQ